LIKGNIQWRKLDIFLGETYNITRSWILLLRPLTPLVTTFHFLTNAGPLDGFDFSF